MFEINYHGAPHQTANKIEFASIHRLFLFLTQKACAHFCEGRLLLAAAMATRLKPSQNGSLK
jgi:hypothetical protein